MSCYGAGHVLVTGVSAHSRSVPTELPSPAASRSTRSGGVRFSAVDPFLGAQPELAMYEMYRLDLAREVMAELLFWMRGFPAMRERSGRVLVRVSRVRRGDDSSAPYDLLWRLAHTPDEVGIDMPAVAALWHMACRHESSRSAAWQVLGELGAELPRLARAPRRVHHAGR